MYDKICKRCGTRLSQFYSAGQLGCPDCYRAFKSEVAVTLRKIQYSDIHKGKRPKVSSSDRELLSEYTFLLHEKEKAGLAGRFTYMAELSNKIAELSIVLKERGLI